jgi:isocitrate dehydrogenase
LAKHLKDNEEKIVSELSIVQGKSVDIGGYFKPDVKKLEQVMRPSATLNQIIGSAK